MPDRSDKGAWAVIRYLPFDTSEGELPAHFDGWFTHRDAAEAVAKNWASEYPEAQVVVIRANRLNWRASSRGCADSRLSGRDAATHARPESVGCC